MDLEAMGRKLMEGADAGALRKLADSEAGRRLSARFDGEAAAEAVRQGDEAQMKAILQSVLRTPEGRELAERLRETMNGHGR